MSVTHSFPDANVRSPTYHVARTRVRCPRCGLSTRLLALAMPRGHETLHSVEHEEVDVHTEDTQQDEPEQNAEFEQDVWQHENVGAFLFYVEGLPGVVQNRLQQLSGCFRLGYDAGAKNTYWANHCEHCAELLGDHELHCEPEGAFVPSSEVAATDIRLLQIREPFAATAGGYAGDPEFFHCMGKG